MLKNEIKLQNDPVIARQRQYLRSYTIEVNILHAGS